MSARFTEREMNRAMDALDDEIFDGLLDGPAIRAIATYAAMCAHQNVAATRTHDIIAGIGLGVMLADHQAAATLEVGLALEDAGYSVAEKKS
jgi:hypothetical protein